MGLSKVIINVGDQGLGRRPLNKDKISGILFFSGNLPSGFSSSDRCKKVYSLFEAEELGIAEGSANHDVHWYHISEYFRGNPEGELWIGYYAVPGGTYDFSELNSMQFVAQGEIRQFAVYAEALTYAASQVTAIQAAIAAMIEPFQPTFVIYGPNLAGITAITGWAGLADNRTLSAPKVVVSLSQDGGGAGKALADSKAYSIHCIGLALGIMSRAGVEQSIGYPAAFDISDGTEMEVLAMANEDLYSAGITEAILGGLKDKGYLVARKRLPDLTGSFFERCPGSVALTNDFAWNETQRTVNKVVRNIRTALAPYVNGTVPVKSDGTLTDEIVGFYQDIAQRPLDIMQADGEISAGSAVIDPTQDILGTSQLVISVTVVPVGIAEEIIVNINLATSL